MLREITPTDDCGRHACIDFLLVEGLGTGYLSIQ